MELDLEEDQYRRTSLIKLSSTIHIDNKITIPKYRNNWRSVGMLTEKDARWVRVSAHHDAFVSCRVQFKVYFTKRTYLTTAETTPQVRRQTQNCITSSKHIHCFQVRCRRRIRSTSVGWRWSTSTRTWLRWRTSTTTNSTSTCRRTVTCFRSIRERWSVVWARDRRPRTAPRARRRRRGPTRVASRRRQQEPFSRRVEYYSAWPTTRPEARRCRHQAATSALPPCRATAATRAPPTERTVIRTARRRRRCTTRRRMRTCRTRASRSSCTTWTTWHVTTSTCNSSSNSISNSNSNSSKRRPARATRRTIPWPMARRNSTTVKWCSRRQRRRHRTSAFRRAWSSRTVLQWPPQRPSTRCSGINMAGRDVESRLGRHP